MKKHLFLLAFAVSALLPAATALAADLDPPPPPPPMEELRPASYDWSGAYVGGWAGSACIDGNLHDNVQAALPAPNTLPFDFENAGCGFKGGVLAGYNHQIDDIVFGIEGDWGMSNEIVTNDDVGAHYTFALDSIATLRGRVGYAFDDTMLFLTAGGAWARGNISSTNGGAAQNLQHDHYGWTVGAGMEHAVTDSLRIRMDYLYTQLANGNYSDPCGAGCNLDLKWGHEQEVRAALIWAF
jgi:outer membrane immunogenic protein